ncbi:MAG: class I SAM-dependent methyltransferase, partial [Dehalococcoidia bacterium]|nr:class I SAM-dependent methyltransferase [Dehalococcoidia bacterium]
MEKENQTDSDNSSKVTNQPDKEDYRYRQESWANLARFYDPFLNLLFLFVGGEGRVRAKFADFINPSDEDDILDICCGTGTLIPLLAERITHGRVIGIDLSPAMLFKIAGKSRSNNVFPLQSDAQNMPFADGYFDKELISLGLHEIPDGVRLAALKEIYRTLKPGGSLFVFDFNLPEGRPARLITRLFVKAL